MPCGMRVEKAWCAYNVYACAGGGFDGEAGEVDSSRQGLGGACPKYSLGNLDPGSAGASNTFYNGKAGSALQGGDAEGSRTSTTEQDSGGGGGGSLFVEQAMDKTLLGCVGCCLVDQGEATGVGRVQAFMQVAGVAAVSSIIL